MATGNQTRPYSIFFGRPVALRVATGSAQTIVNCMIIDESDGAVRVRLGGVWDVDIYKEMILAVETIEHPYEPEFTSEKEFAYAN